MIAVVHLVWAPLGRAPVREFIASYRAHPAGEPHELIVLLNGAEQGTSAPLLAELAGVEHRLIALERPMQDLAAYGDAALRLSHRRLCLLNSYAVLGADGWLTMLDAALSQPGVGVVAASGSWESQAEWIRGARRHWPKQLLMLAGARRDFPRFPNPHLRTSAFMAERETLISMQLEGVRDKSSAYLMESGRDSITAQVRRRGQRTLVVGRDGRSLDVEEWPASATFRSGDQGNLLIADNQTRAYEAARPGLRRRLSRDAWGPPGGHPAAAARARP